MRHDVRPVEPAVQIKVENEPVDLQTGNSLGDTLQGQIIVKAYCMSIDGNKEIQDKQCPLPNGKGTYEMTVPKVRKLLRVFPGTSCRGTILDDRHLVNSSVKQGSDRLWLCNIIVSQRS